MVMETRPIAFVDVETTGGTARDSRILEIGIIRVERGRVVASMNQVLDPEELVPHWITTLTGIAEHETRSKPVFLDVLPQLKELFYGAVFVAHNVTFDYSFFREEYRRANSTFAMDRLCTVRLSRALYPGEQSHRLDEVIRRSGYSVANRHRAYDDAEVLYKFWHDNVARLGPAEFYTLANRLVQVAAP